MSEVFYYFLEFFQGKIWGFSSQHSGNTATQSLIVLETDRVTIPTAREQTW